MQKLNWWKAVCAACVFCAAAALNGRAQTYTTLANFGGPNGINPLSTLVQGTDGNFYGTTFGGGPTDIGGGTVYRLTPGGTLTTIYRFCPKSKGGSDCPDGYEPWAGLVLGSDESLYGTTLGGGANGDGAVFKITQTGALTVLHSFAGADGFAPAAALVQGSDGNFYGTTTGGGAGNSGTVFRIAPTGELTTLHNFNGLDGYNSQAPLIQGTDGNFYGTTVNGGLGGGYYCSNFSCGTVFKMTPQGSLTTLHQFCAEPNCSDGALPSAGLVEASNGSFSGATVSGGEYSNDCEFGCGTVFKISSAGALTTLHDCNIGDCADTVSALTLATDGNFYDTSAAGGEQGTIFEVAPPGRVNDLWNFEPDSACNPRAGLLQATDGTFYGTTTAGSNFNPYGSAFSFSVGLGPFVTTLPTSRAVGQRVAILGNNLTGATSVTFNGVPATFSVLLETEISTTVPTGATTGPVQVLTPSGTLTSNVPFRVTQ
ncbi:MAG TPA: choice-of-anchor tandem repeat GloVer-containing protein [Terriglobia bacterium]